MVPSALDTVCPATKQADKLGQPVPAAAGSKYKATPWQLAAGAPSCKCLGLRIGLLACRHARDSVRQHQSQQQFSHRTFAIAGLQPSEANTQAENWCGVLQEVALPMTGADPSAFLRAAVEYANNECWGTLACRCVQRPACC